MLILSRKLGEEIVLPTLGITIVVADIRPDGSRVRIGIDAPTHMPVHRLELWQKLQKEHKRATDDNT